MNFVMLGMIKKDLERLLDQEMETAFLEREALENATPDFGEVSDDLSQLSPIHCLQYALIDEDDNLRNSTCEKVYKAMRKLSTGELDSDENYYSFLVYSDEFRRGIKFKAVKTKNKIDRDEASEWLKACMQFIKNYIPLLKHIADLRKEIAAIDNAKLG